MCDKDVELTVRLPGKLHRALCWYAPMTGHWAGPQAEAEAVNALIVDGVRLLLETEANDPTEYIEFVKSELRVQLEA
jgi:hypothetical protein